MHDFVPVEMVPRQALWLSAAGVKGGDEVASDIAVGSGRSE
jgi:hypothetical protein